MARSPIEITALLVAGDFAAIRDDFDATMNAALPVTRLREAWQQLIGRNGDYVGVGGGPSASTRDGYRVVDRPLHFDRFDAKLRVTYDGSERIAGLFLLNPEVV